METLSVVTIRIEQFMGSVISVVGNQCCGGKDYDYKSVVI
jgi:hypothetical protein